MDDDGIAGRLASEIREGNRKRIQVRNVHHPEEILLHLSSTMEDTRIITFRFNGGNPLRETLCDYFAGNRIPDMETAFEAGWRSHVTETALVGAGSGMEAAAGLNSLREPLWRFLNGGEVSEEVVSGVLSSFSLTLPTVFLLLDYQGNRPFDSTGSNLPPIVAFTPGHTGFPFADLILDSGHMSPASARRFLREFGSDADVEEVLLASEGRAGLVRLFAGIREVFGVQSKSARSMLHSVLDSNVDLARFASVAALMSPGFIPAEVYAVSGTSGSEAFDTGRRINLWRGHLVADFHSTEARREILGRIDEEEKRDLLTAGSKEVLRVRGISGVSLGLAGDLLFRAGKCREASKMFSRASELESRELKRAELYGKAALAWPEENGELSFLASLSLFREQACDPPETVPRGLTVHQFPELSPLLAQAEELFTEGKFHRAYMVLAELALEGEGSMTVALAEIGGQLLRRNIVESALNVYRAAAAHASKTRSRWLEANALAGCLKACNRSGRFRESWRITGRLFQLALESGNRTRLVGAYNLYANSLLLQTRYGSALKVYTSCLRTMDENQGEALRPVVLNNMSVAQRRLFRIEEALGSLMRFAKSAVSRGSLLQAAIAYGNMARLFIDLSRFDSATDCLETMIEFRKISGNHLANDSVMFISSQIAFAEGHTKEALLMMENAVEGARAAGNLRRLSLNLVKLGSMLLRTGEYENAAQILERAEEASLNSSSMLNAFVARVKGTAARCFCSLEDPASLLSIPLSGAPEDTHRGEQFYYHWRLTGSLQSMAASAQLLSRGLERGLHLHSYLHMLHEIAHEMPASLAVAIPLVHNYPSRDQVKGD